MFKEKKEPKLGHAAQVYHPSSSHHHSRNMPSNLCKTPTRTHLMYAESHTIQTTSHQSLKSNLSWYNCFHQSRFGKVCMESIWRAIGFEVTHWSEAEHVIPNGLYRKKFFSMSTGNGTELPYHLERALLYAANIFPKLTGRGIWVFVLVCFLIFWSVWENYVCDPSTENSLNLSSNAKL